MPEDLYAVEVGLRARVRLGVRVLPEDPYAVEVGLRARIRLRVRVLPEDLYAVEVGVSPVALRDIEEVHERVVLAVGEPCGLGFGFGFGFGLGYLL